jgi:hypothetical protein
MSGKTPTVLKINRAINQARWLARAARHKATARKHKSSKKKNPKKVITAGQNGQK